MFWKRKPKSTIYKGESVTLIRAVFVFNNSSCYIDYWVSDYLEFDSHEALKYELAGRNGTVDQNGKLYRLQNHQYIYCYNLAKGIVKEDVNWDYMNKDKVKHLVEKEKF